MDNEEIREGFEREYQGAQDARSQLHANFSQQGIQLIGDRKRLIEIVITISAAFIAAPVVFKVEPNLHYYHIGLMLLIFTVIFSLLHLREHVDVDEARMAQTRNKLLPILNRRIEKLKGYLNQNLIGVKEASEYKLFREQEDHGEELTKLSQSNEEEIKQLPLKAIDYPSALIMYLFTSGALFILVSILFQGIPLLVIISIEVLLFIITSTNSAEKLTEIYAMLVSFLKRKI